MRVTPQHLDNYIFFAGGRTNATSHEHIYPNTADILAIPGLVPLSLKILKRRTTAPSRGAIGKRLFNHDETRRSVIYDEKPSTI
jgi:hypothetical protein